MNRGSLVVVTSRGGGSNLGLLTVSKEKCRGCSRERRNKGDKDRVEECECDCVNNVSTQEGGQRRRRMEHAMPLHFKLYHVIDWQWYFPTEPPGSQAVFQCSKVVEGTLLVEGHQNALTALTHSPWGFCHRRPRWCKRCGHGDAEYLVPCTPAGWGHCFCRGAGPTP